MLEHPHICKKNWFIVRSTIVTTIVFNVVAKRSNQIVKLICAGLVLSQQREP